MKRRHAVCVVVLASAGLSACGIFSGSPDRSVSRGDLNDCADRACIEALGYTQTLQREPTEGGGARVLYASWNGTNYSLATAADREGYIYYSVDYDKNGTILNVVIGKIECFYQDNYERRCKILTK